ncbi:MAG: DUF4838 domain-containing protein, partial [Phycisphaerae bacterium]|nr:DUF4838 domain-containing protein [Phycisphaerae bacterium]
MKAIRCLALVGLAISLLLLAQPPITQAANGIPGLGSLLGSKDGKSKEAAFVLVKDGQPAATIVIAEAANANARTAAAELQTYVKKMSGAELTIATDAKAVAGPLVLVGKSKLTDEITDLNIPAGRTKKLREEGFIVRTVGDRLVLAGNDEEPYLGTRYAVIHLLDRLGVRWFMPGEMGEIVPKLSTLQFESLNIMQRPDFPVRSFWEQGRDNMKAQENEWMIHNFMNPKSIDAIGCPYDGSITEFIKDISVQDHPDWFAQQQNGGRNGKQPCTTSEPMIQHMIEKIKERARKGEKVTSFAPEDGMPRCWCGNCSKLSNSFDGYGSNDRDPLPEACVSNEWFYFVNRILDGVNEEFPDHIIATNGYANRDVPPELPPDIKFNKNKNLTVMFANICACTIHSYDDPKCWQMKRQGEMVRTWATLSDKVWIYNYNYTMLINKGTLTPMVHRLRRNLPLLNEWGVIGFHDQDEGDLSISGLPTRIVRARLQWNTKADVDAILDDFFTKWFGPAAKPMKAYYDALENAFEKATVHGHEDVILPSIYTDKLMAELDKHIHKAESLATTDEHKLRMKMERAFYNVLCT